MTTDDIKSRLFALQDVPYRDFQDYLGLGHLYAGTMMTAVFGGNYHGSLMGFTFLSVSGLSLCSLMVGMAVFKKKETAAGMTNLLLLLLLLKPAFFVNGISWTEDILQALNYAMETGNSARFIRGLILPLSVFLLWLAVRGIKALSFRHNYSGKTENILLTAAIGLIAGFSFTWCNDYGICCWICLAVMTFWIVLSRTRSLLSAVPALFLELGASLAGLFLSAEIFTLGHFRDWALGTFGAGGYQAWYYNSYHNSYYIFDVIFSYPALFQAVLAVILLAKLFRERGKGGLLSGSGILAYANMACFCAVSEYKLLSGGSSREVSLAVLFLTAAYSAVELILRPAGSAVFRKYLFYATAAAGIAWCVLAGKEEFVFSRYTEKKGIYNEALGGYLTERGQDLIDADEFLDGETFFASYASAQEVVSGKFQPSGTDYIIHVLGDRQREKYLDSFLKGDFKYAATIRESFSDWEYWVQRANWYFYRELYEKWHPVYADSYELFWERNAFPDEFSEKNVCRAQAINVNDHTKKIKVECDAPVSGTADVLIDYEVVRKNMFSSRLVFNTDLTVRNTYSLSANKSFYEMNHLRPVSKEFIPIRITEGYGEAELTSNPALHTLLRLNSVSCERIFTTPSVFLEMTEPFEYRSDNTVITIKNTPQNYDAVRDAASVVYRSERFPVEEVSQGPSGIAIVISGRPELSHENMIRAER